LGDEGVDADFWLLLAPAAAGARAEAVKFIHGSDSLRAAADRLRAVDFGGMFPNEKPVKLVRRGKLACTAKTTNCTLILSRPEEIRAPD